MTQMVFMLAFIIAIGVWEVLKLLWWLILWATQPIRQELAFRRMVKEEMQKEQRIVEVHNEAVRQIDNVVADCLDRHEQALAQSDHESGRRQSASSSEASTVPRAEPESAIHEPQSVVPDPPKGTHLLWFSDSRTGSITLRAERRQNGSRIHP